MKKILPLILSPMVSFSGPILAQERPTGPPPEGAETGQRPPRRERPQRGGGGPRPENLGESDAELGSPGIAWYPILKDGLAEAKRSNKPILFMAAASQCSGISGVF